MPDNSQWTTTSLRSVYTLHGLLVDTAIRGSRASHTSATDTRPCKSPLLPRITLRLITTRSTSAFPGSTGPKRIFCQSLVIEIGGLDSDNRTWPDESQKSSVITTTLCLSCSV